MSNQNSAALHNAWDGTTKLQGPLCLCRSIHLMTENAIIEVNNHVVFCLSTAPTTAHGLINTDNAFPGQSVCSTVQKKRQRISNGPLIRTDAFLSLVITVVNPIDLLRSTYTLLHNPIQQWWWGQIRSHFVYTADNPQLVAVHSHNSRGEQTKIDWPTQ